MLDRCLELPSWFHARAVHLSDFLVLSRELLTLGAVGIHARESRGKPFRQRGTVRR